MVTSAFADAVKKDPSLEVECIAWQKSRRAFLKNLGLATGGFVLGTAFAQKKTSAPVIAIVGGGMAGLNAAYQFKKQGISSTVYEASKRSGGRMFTIRDHFGAGLTTDIGGEFVDTTHADILQLAKEFNLEMYDLRKDGLSPKSFFFQGKALDQSDLRKAIAPFVKPLMKDLLSLPPLIDHRTAEHFSHLDKQSITEYLGGLGVTGWLFDFLNIVLTNEYGMEASEQSAINFLIMFIPPLETAPDYELFGETHEVYKIKGGSQHLTNAMQEQLQDRLVMQHRLTGLHARPNGYELIFEAAGKEKKIYADFVLLAIPFTMLRSVDFSVPMPALKRRCIDEIGYGNSCKFVLGVDRKPWRAAGKQGYTFTDESFRTGWDSSQSQSETRGSFTVFGGGNFSGYISAQPESVLSARFTADINKIYPGMDNDYNHRNLKYCWANYPFTKAAYSAFRKGQWSELSGWEGEPVGNIFFAGEHVSKEYQGYMNGAAETARVATELIVKRISLTKVS